MEKLYRLEELCPCVREVGVQRYDSWRTRPRLIYDHEILYCFSGNANIRIGDTERLLAEGDLVIIPPDTPHTFWVEENGGELYWLHCDFECRDDSDWIYNYYNTPELYARLFSGELQEKEHIRPHALFFDGVPLPTFASFAGSDEVDIIFRTLYKLYTRKDEAYAIDSKVLMLRLLREIFTSQGQFAQAGASSHERICGIIRSVVQSNYYRKLTVREICECTHLNPEYAGKVFRRATGVSVIDFLNRYRIDRAKKLLLDTDLTIADVGDMVGFQSLAYFSNVARKITGMNPTQLRLHMLSLMENMHMRRE